MKATTINPMPMLTGTSPVKSGFAGSLSPLGYTILPVVCMVCPEEVASSEAPNKTRAIPAITETAIRNLIFHPPPIAQSRLNLFKSLMLN